MLCNLQQTAFGRRGEWFVQQAVKNVNASPSVLPNATLFITTVPANADAAKGVAKLLELNEQVKLSGLVGPYFTHVAQPVTLVCQSIDLSVISQAASASFLSDFPYFSRLCPDDSVLSDMIAVTMQDYGWSRLGVISSYGAYATNFVVDLRNAAAAMDVDVSVSSTIESDNSDDVQRTFAALLATDTRIVVIGMLAVDVVKLFKTIDSLGISTDEFVFVGSDWYDEQFFDRDLPKHLVPRFEGSLGVLGSGGISEKQQSLISACAVDLPDDCAISDAYMSFGYDAVIAFALALTSLRKTSNSTSFSMQQISDSARQQDFVGASGRITMSNSGDRTRGDITVKNFANGKLHVVKHVRYQIDGLAGNTFQDVPDTELSTALFQRPTEARIMNATLTTVPPTYQLAICNPGTYLDPAEGCRPCRPGFFSDSVNALACIPCDVGSFSTESLTRQCSLCTLGRFSTFVGATACSACLSGSYASIEGSVACRPCASNSESNLNRTSCLCRTTKYEVPQNWELESPTRVLDAIIERGKLNCLTYDDNCRYCVRVMCLVRFKTCVHTNLTISFVIFALQTFGHGKLKGPRTCAEDSWPTTALPLRRSSSIQPRHWIIPTSSPTIQSTV
jgi:ABC-type branched-subunit amino acid transport system substrate-binding protein